MLNLKMTENDFKLDIGHADLYHGKQYKYPYFFDSPSKRMMKDMGDDTIDFKTWKGEFFQFTIGEFHHNSVLVVTSTLQDYCFFKVNTLSFEAMKAWIKECSEKKCMIKGSFSGYATFGKGILRNFETLEQHMAEQEIYFTDEVLHKIHKELVRRAK